MLFIVGLGIGGIIVLGINHYIVQFSKNYIVANIEGLNPTTSKQAILILGSKVKRDDLSQILEDRVKTAIKLYHTHPHFKILVSGDNGSQYYNEVGAIAKYLKKKGISRADIFLDYAGFDTYDSIYRAKHIFQVQSMVIVTQKFHLARAVYIARSLGIQAYGLEADLHQYPDERRNILREYMARIKAYRDVQMGSLPRYGGEAIPITGQSNMISWHTISPNSDDHIYLSPIHKYSI